MKTFETIVLLQRKAFEDWSVVCRLEMIPDFEDLRMCSPPEK